MISFIKTVGRSGVRPGRASGLLFGLVLAGQGAFSPLQAETAGTGLAFSLLSQPEQAQTQRPDHSGAVAGYALPELGGVNSAIDSSSPARLGPLMSAQLRQAGERLLDPLATPQQLAGLLQQAQSSDIDVHGRLMGLGDQALQSVVDSGLSGIENWAQTGFSFLRSLHLDYRAPLAGRESLIQADVTVSLWEGSSAAVFGQGGLQLHGDEGGANVGLGYRKLVREDLLIGANLFYDYLSDPSLERWSVGAEIKTELLDFYLNRYQGTGTELIGNTLHYSPDGWDAELAGRLPQLPWAELGLRYYRWDGQRGDVDLEGLRWRLLLQPVPLFGVRFELDRPESGESSDFGLEATLEYQFGVPLDQQLDKAEVRLRSPWERRYERAHREYQIRARSRQVAVGAPPPGTGAARLLTTGAGAGVYGVNVDGSCAFQDGLIDRIVGSLREGSQACLRLQLQAPAAPSQDSAGTLQAGERVRILFEGAASAGVDYELGQVRVAEGDGMVLPVDASAASFEAEFAEQRQLTLEIVLNALTDGSTEEAELVRMRPESGVAEAVLLIVDAAAPAHVSLRLLDDGVSTEGRPDDPARFEIALDRAQAAGAGALTVSLSVQPAPAEDDYTVFSDVSTTPLSPVGGNVYELNFEEGVQRREFRLQANEDADMDSETLSLSLTEPSDGSYLPVSDAVDVLLQDTDLPMLNLVATGESEIDEETDEAGRTRQLELQVTPAEHPRLTVAYTVSGVQRADFTLSGTGVAFDSDSALGGRIELAQNVGSVQITLVVSADTQTESAEELVLTLQPDPEQYLFAEVASARYTIAASDALEVSALALSPALAAEGENYTVSVTLSQSPGTDLELGYTITPGASGLVQPDDFADLDELSGTLRVPAGTPAGTAVQVLELALAQDGLTEGDENFLFRLAGPGPAQAYTLAADITFIIDRQITDASFSEVEISSADPVATEETVADSAEIVVTLGPTASGVDDIQVGLMIDPDSSMIAYTVTDASGTVVDFSTGTAMLSFPAGTSEQSQTLSVALSADDGNTTNETLAVNLQSGTGYQVGSASSLELILQDDDLPELTLGRAGSGPLMQGDTETLTLTVSPATHPELTVSYTVTGTVAAADYELSIAGGSVGMLAHDGTAGIGTITVPQDAAEVTLTLALATDMEVEGAETLSFRLSLGDGYRLGSPDRQIIDVAASGEVMISALTLSPEATMPMGEGGAYTVSMTLSASPSLALRVPYRISSVVGSIELDDFDGLPALTGELRVPAGTAVGAVQVLELRLEQDGRSEVAETFAFQLDPAPIGAPPYSLADDADDPVERPITDTSFSSARLIVEDRITVEPVSSVVNEASVEVVLAATDVAVELPVQFTPDPSIANYAVRISSGQLSISGGTTMLSFPASTSEQRQTLFIFALIDDLDTISDIVEIRLSDPAPDAAYVLGLPFEANIQLIDDDVPQVRVSQSTGTAADEGAAVSLRLALLSHNRHPRLPAVAYTISGVQVGDFELAGDFDGNAGTDDAVRTALTGTVEIPESTGSSGVPLTLTLVQDATTEGAETLTFTLMDGPGYTVVTGDAASIIINDTSRTPVAGISTTSPDPLTENNLGTATLTVTLTDTEYVQASSLNAAQFTLVTTVPGVTVDTISRTDATNVVLTLAYDGSDFDTAATLAVTVAAAAHTGAGDLDTGTVPVTAVAESSNAQLIALELSAGMLTPDFARATTTYTATVDNSVRELTVTPTAADADGASITDNTTAIDSGMASSPIPLDVGPNSIAVVVTAADGSTMTYTVTVTRMTAPGAPTAAITASTPSSLSESNLNTATLTVTLTNTAYEPSLNAAQFTLVTAVSGVTVNTVSRTDATNAELTLTYDGSDFDTTAMLVVTVADAAHTGSGNLNTDAVTVTAVDESTDANLNALELSVGVLDPSFDSATTAYAATVENSVSSLTVTPTASDATGASITVDDVAVVSGMASGEITLDVGENPIAVEVTAEDGNTMTYTVMVTRRGPPTAAITATDPSPLTEGNLDGARLTVTLTNTAYEAGLVVNLFTLNTDVPGVTVSGLSFIGIGSGLTGVVLTLAYDGSNFDDDETLAVTVADAAHTGAGDLNTGTVSVTAVAESSNAQLSALVLSESTTLVPTFVSAMTSYTAMVANSVSSLTVTPTAADAGAIITVNTVTVASSVASGPVTLNVGPNPIAVVVTAADGSTMTYTVTVTRLAAITFGGDTAGAVTEDDNAANTATGTLTVTNPGGGGTDVVAPTEPSIYGTFAIVADTGDWTYTLNNADDDTNALPAGDVQMETFTIATVADPSVTQVVTITINGANDAPTVEISAPTGSPQVLFGAMLTLTATGEDPDTGATLTYAWSANPDVGSFANATIASTTWTAPASGTDSATLTLTVTDNAGSSASASFDITLVGPEASITAPSSLSVDEANVNGAQVTVTLANTEYVASPIADHFELSGTSGFVMIGGVDRVVGSDTAATLTLSYDRASVGDITDQLDITITLLAAGHTGAGDLLAPETLIIVPTPDLAPTFGSDTINPQTYTVSAAVDVTLPAATGGDGTLNYTLAPALPDGLTFGAPASRTIIGTPTTVTAEATYTYTVTDSDTTSPDSVELMFTIEVVAAATDLMPTFGSNAIGDLIYTVGTAVSVTLPEATSGDGALTHAISAGTLPTGLAFNPTTRVLEGTPTVVQASMDYTYTATDSDSGATLPSDSVNLPFTITITAAPTATIDTPSSLTEAALLAGATVTVMLTDTEYVGTLAANLFTVTLSGSGVTVSMAARTSNVLATLTLAYGGTGIDADTTLGITVLAAAHSGTGNLDTALIPVTATPPSLAGATFSVAENATAATTVGTPLAAAEFPSGTQTWAIVSGNDDGDFNIAEATGQLTVAADDSINFEDTPSYTLEVSLTIGTATAQATVTVTVSDEDEPPLAPAAPTVTPGVESLAVTWTAPDNNGPAITGYNVEYRTGGGAFTLASPGPGTATSLTITGLTASTLYEVQVRATNAEGDGPYSALGTGTPMAPPTLTATISAPTTAIAEAALSGAELVVTLSNTEYVGTLEAVQFTINHGTGASGVTVSSVVRTGNMVATLTLAYTSGIDADTTLGVTVVAAAHTGDDALTTDNTVMVTATLPSLTGATFPVPENTVANTDVGTPLAAAEFPSGTQTWAIVSGNDDGDFNIAEATGQLTVAADDSINFEDTASYMLVVSLTIGTAMAQATVTVTVSDENEPPSAPAAPTVTAEVESLTVTWTAPDNNGPAITGYNVEYRTGGGAFTLASPGPGTATSLTITGLTASTLYEVQVRATNAEGDGPYSALGTGTPMAPPTLTATISAPTTAIAEAALSGAELVVTLSNTEYVGTLEAVQFTINHGIGASGVTVSSVVRTGNMVATLTLAYTSGIDADTTLGVTVVAAAHTGDDALTTDNTVMVTATPPSLTGATFPVPENTVANTDVGTPLAAAEFPSGTQTWAIVSGNDDGDFNIDTATGQLSVAANDSINFEDTPSYTLEVSLTIGTATAQATVAVTVDDVEEPPSAPAAPTVTPGVESLAVTWTAPDNNGPAITGYNVEYRLSSSAPAGAYTDAGHSGTTPDITIPGLTASMEYQVRVRATNAEGDGPYSALGMGTPMAPTTPTATISAPTTAIAEADLSGTMLAVTLSDTEYVGTLAAAQFTINHGTGASGVTVGNVVRTSPTVATLMLAYTSGIDADTTLGVTVVAAAHIGDDALTTDNTVMVTATPPSLAGATFTVPENTAADTDVGTPLAAAEFPSGTQTWAIVSGNTGGDFNIAEATGQLTVAANDSINFEDTPSYTLEVSLTIGAATAQATVTVTVTDEDEPPSAPAAPTVTPGVESLAVTWTAPDNNGPAITGYNVEYRLSSSAPAGVYTDAGHSGTTPDITIPGLTASMEYQVRVRATNAEGDGPYSALGMGTPMAPTTPTATISAPTTAIAEAALSGTELAVTLSNTEYVGTLEAVQFTINHGTGASGVTVSGVVRTSPTVATLTLAYTSGIDADTTLGVTVVAAAHTGDDALTTDNTVMVTATAPSLTGATFTVPENTAADTDVGTPLAAAEFPSGTQTWAIVSGNTGGDFNIAEATGQLTVAANDSINFEDTASYTLVVSLTIGTAMAQATVTVTVSDENEPPLAPAAPTVTAAAESLNVNWTAPANNGPEITSYDVQYRTGADAFTLASPGPGAATSLTITGLTASTLYEVQVRAVNAEGMSTYSAPGTGTPLSGAAPTAVISATNPDPLTEDNLVGATLTVTLMNTAYVGSLSAGQFRLDTAVPSVTVDAVSRTGATNAVLMLAYGGVNFDNDATLGVTVAADAHTGDNPLITNRVSVTANTPPMITGLRMGTAPITEIMVTAGAAPVLVQVIAVDMTDEADALTYSLPGSVPDYVTISNSGLITVDPFELIAAVPTATFSVRVMDDSGETDERDFNLTVVAPPLPVNSPPQITSAPFMLDVIAGQSQSVLVSASDPDAGDMPTIAVTASDDPDYITFSAATGLVTVAPPISTPPTTHAVSITVSDGAGSSVRKEGSVVRVLANPSPILAPINTQMVQAGTSRMVQVTATDNEGDPITYSVSGSDLVSIDPVTGLITIDARAETAAALAPVTVTVRATGGVGGSFSERSFELTITAPPLSNLAPVITPIGGLVVLAGRRVDVPIEVMDPDGNPIELILSGTPPAYIRLLDETVVIEPPVDTGAATHTVTVTASDGFGGSDSEEFPVVVRANSPPVISVIDDVDVQAGASRTVQAVATDVDGDPIAYGVGGSDLVSINSATGLITIDAGDATAAAGPVTITVTAMAATLQDMETFALTITAPPTGVPALSLAFGEEGDTRTGTTETLEEAQSDFLRLILSEPSSTAVTVSYEISGVDEGDYELAVAMAGGNGAMLAQVDLTGTVEIPPNAGSVTLALRINLDSDVELAETLRFELVTSASYSLGDPSALEVQVPHNGIPEVRTPADDPNAPVMIDEGAEATLTFQVDPAPWPEALTVSYQIEGAADSSDYVLSGLPVTQDGNMGTVTIPAQTPAQGAVLRLMATEDGVTEQDAPEVFTLLLTDPVEEGYSLVRRARRAPFFDSGTFAIRDTSFGEVSLSVSPDPAIATEGVTTEDVVVTATFSNAPQGISGSIPVFVEILGSVGNPMPGDDYEVSGINVVNGDSRFAMGVSAGMRSTSLTIRALADNDNDEEALIVRLVGGDGYKLGAESEVAVTLRNAQPQLRLVRSGSGALMEGAPADTLTLTVVSSITGMPLAIHPQLTVPYTISGPGITTADYTLEGTGLAATGLTGTVVVPAGSGSVMLMLSIVDDGTAELEESLTFTLDPPISGYTLAMDTDSVMIPIAQNGMPAVAVTAVPPAKVDEGGSATLTLALDPAGWTEELVVNYAVSGTGITTADYTLEGTGLAATGLTGRVTIPASTASGTVTLTLMAVTDAANEGTETLSFMLSMGTGYTVAGPAAGIIIRDVVAGGTAGTVAPDLSLTRAGTGPVQEGAMEMLTLTVAATPHSQLTVPYTISGTGITGADYTLEGTGLTETGLTGMVVIPANAGSVTLTLSIVADAPAELAEQLLFTLSDDTGYDLDSPSFQSIEIPVNGMPEVRVTADSVNLMEGGSAAVLRLALAPAPWPNDLNVGYRVAGTNVTRADYDLADGTATVSDRVQVPMNTLAGGVTVLLSALADNTSEGTETFRFELVAGSGYTLGTSDAADIMVSDDSLSQVRLFSNDTIAREGDADDLASVAVTLPPSQVAIADILVAIMPDTAAFSVIDADGNTVMPNAEGQYELDFPASSTSQTQLLGIRAGDDDNTDDETLQVSLVAPESGAGYRLLDGSTDLTVILRDDDMPEISVRVIEQDTETAVSQLEEGAMARVRLALTSPAPATGLEVTYAIGGVSADDFVLAGSSSGSGVFRVDAGMRMQDYMLSITDDTTGELAELLTLTLTDPGATARYTVDSSADSFGVTIPLNDRPQVVITADVNSLNEGSQTTVRFRVVPAPWPQALSVRYTLGSDNVADGDFRLTGDFDGDDGTADAPLTELTPESNFETVMIPADTGPGGVELTLMADADESFDGVAGERRSETLRIALANPQSGAGYTLGNPREQAIEIMDTSVPANPNARNASLALSMDTAIEGGSPALLSVTFDEPAVEATTVQFNIEGRLTAAGSLAPGDLDPPRVPPVVDMDYEVRDSEGTILPASTMGCAAADGDCYLLMIMAGERTASVQIQALHDDEEEINDVSTQVGAYENLDIMLIEQGTPLLYTADPDAVGSQASLRLQHTIPDVVLSFPDGAVLVDEPGAQIRMRVEVSHQPHPPLRMRVVLPGGGGFSSNTVLRVDVPSAWGEVTTGTAGFGSTDQEHNFNIPSDVTAGDVTISVSTRDQNSEDLMTRILVRLVNTDVRYTFSGRSSRGAIFPLEIVEIDFLYSAVQPTGLTPSNSLSVEAHPFLNPAVASAAASAAVAMQNCVDPFLGIQLNSVRLHFQLSGAHETIMVPYSLSSSSGASVLDGDDFRLCGDFDGDGTVEISNDLSGTLTFPATPPDAEFGASRTLEVWLIDNGNSEQFQMLFGEGEGYDFAPDASRTFNGREFTSSRLLGFSIAQPGSL